MNDNPSTFFSLPSEGTTGYESAITYLYSDADLPLYSLFFGHPLMGGIAEVGSQVLAHPLYNESHILINYHMNWNVFNFGINERFLDASVKNGTHSSSFITDCGLGLKVSDFQTSMSIHNIFQADYQDIPLSQLYVTEMMYRPMESTSIALGCEKQQGYGASFQLSTKYKVSPAFQFIAGYQYNPDRFSGGLEFTVRHWQLCYALQTHPDLDLTHGISLMYK